MGALVNAGWAAYLLGTLLIGWYSYRNLSVAGLARGEAFIGAFLAWGVFFYIPFFVFGALGLSGAKPLVAPGYLMTALAVGGIPFIALGLPARLVPFWRSALSGIAPNAKLSRPAAVAMGTLIAFGVGLVALLAPQFPRGYEPIAYHLPLAVWMLQSGTLDFWDKLFVHAVPHNASLLYGALLGTGSERLVMFANVPLAGALVIVLWRTAVALGANSSMALIVSIGTASMPIVAFSAMECAADIGMMLFAAVALYFMILASRQQSLVLAALAGAAIGLSAGFKTNGIIYFGLIALYPVVAMGVSRRTVRLLVAFGAVGTLLVAFWWGRNWILLGNPFHPVNIPLLSDLFGWTPAAFLEPERIAKIQFQWVRSSAEWLVYPWVEWHYIEQNFKHSSGTGSFFAAIVPVTLALAGTIAKAEPLSSRRAVAALLAMIGLSTLVWWATIRDPRYWITTIIFLMPLSAVLLSRLDATYRRIVEWVLLGATLMMLALFAMREVIVFGDRILYSGHHVRHRAFEYPPAIDTLPEGSVIMNTGVRTWHYPLAGVHLRNRVISAVLTCTMLTTMRSYEPESCGSETLTLDGSKLRALGVTHIFSEEAIRYESMDGTELRVVDTLTHNPVSKAPLPSPRMLFEIRYPAATVDAPR